MNMDVKAKLEQADEHYEALLAAERDRATYLLASMIVDPLNPEHSISDLERLGEEKLRMIVTWLNQSAESKQV